MTGCETKNNPDEVDNEPGVAECYLGLKSGGPAAVYAGEAAKADEDEIFTLWHKAYSFSGEESTIDLPVYSKQKANLYMQKGKEEMERLASLWDDKFFHAYGYWATLMRLGIARIKWGARGINYVFLSQ